MRKDDSICLFLMLFKKRFHEKDYNGKRYGWNIQCIEKKHILFLNQAKKYFKMNFHQHCFFQLAHLQILQCKLMQMSQSLQQLAMFFWKSAKQYQLVFWRIWNIIGGTKPSLAERRKYKVKSISTPKYINSHKYATDFSMIMLAYVPQQLFFSKPKSTR